MLNVDIKAAIIKKFFQPAELEIYWTLGDQRFQSQPRPFDQSSLKAVFDENLQIQTYLTFNQAKNQYVVNE